MTGLKMGSEKAAAFSEAARMMKNAIFVVGRSPMPWDPGECCLDGDMKLLELVPDGRGLERAQRKHLEDLLAEMDKVIVYLETKSSETESRDQFHGGSIETDGQQRLPVEQE